MINLYDKSFLKGDQENISTLTIHSNLSYSSAIKFLQ